MAHKHMQTLWVDTQIQLGRLLKSEIPGPKGFENKRQANDYVRRLFLNYNDILKKLDDIYQTLIHPQKRLIIRILLDGIVGRLIELKQEMIHFDNCEYTYFEDLALDQNKTLDDLRIEVPRYFAQDRFKAIEQRNQMIKMILDRKDQSEYLSTRPSLDSLSIEKNNQSDMITMATAVRVLQAHERARQGRVHAYFMQQMKKEMKVTAIKSAQILNLADSCLIIQTIWRQKYAEKLLKLKKMDEEKMLGMILPRRVINNLTVDDDNNKKKRDLQIQNQEEFDKASVYIKQKIRQYEESEVKSRIEHVLHQWLLESRQLYGQFPIYPSDEINGSAILFKEMAIADVQDFVNKQAQLLKNKKAKRKEIKQQTKKSKKKSTKTKSNINELQPSKFLSLINDQMGVYNELFYGRDEFYNQEQHYDTLLAMDKFRPEVEDELCKEVDIILRNELVYLKLAIDNTVDKQKTKRKKKKKKKKKKRSKKVKDIVANRTNDSIFEELVETGIIIPTKSVRLNDFIGDYQYLTETLRYNEKEPMPSLLDFQQLVVLQIIFPLGSETVHLNLPSRKAVLLAGPRGSGKELLVHIACNELGGLLLDLSPANLFKSFNSADGLKVLFAMIKRLVVAMPPLVCMVRDTELLYTKKLTAQEKEFEPGRFKRTLRTLIRKFKPGERIMLVGISAQPYRARMKQLLQIYDRIILFPRANYGSRRKLLYEILIEKNNMTISDVELSILASISNGYTAGQIVETINKVIDIKRANKYSNNICTTNDFIPILGLQTPMFVDEENKIKHWYSRTPNGAQRLAETIIQTSMISGNNRKRTTKS